MRNLQLYLKYDLIYKLIYIEFLMPMVIWKWKRTSVSVRWDAAVKVEREFELIIFFTGLETEAHGKQAKWAAGGAAWLGTQFSSSCDFSAFFI